MIPFTYSAAGDTDQAINLIDDNSRYLAGGTTLIDLMKLDVEHPAKLVDINALPFSKIEPLPDGGLRIGAMVRNTELAYDPAIQQKYPLLSQAILSGASPQLRNMATTGGNLLQRTRCYYFRDTAYPCNKREPGSGCSAINGFNRQHAILGTSKDCIATHPSDMTVALAAIGAFIRLRGKNGAERSIPFEQFYIAYGENPSKENIMNPGELITAVDLPSLPFAVRSTYLKVRDRAEYEFALTSAAVALNVDNGTIREARIALGGVATKPWRAMIAEHALAGQKPTIEAFTAAADAELKTAAPQKDNGFKIELCKRTIIRACEQVAAMT